MRRALVMVVIVAALLALLYWTQQRQGPAYVSGFIEVDDARVGSRVGGRIQAVHVEEGDRVSHGALLVELDPYDLNERLAEAEAALAAREATLARLKAGYRQEDIAQARARRDQAQAQLNKAKAGQRPLEIQILVDQLDLAQAEFDDAEREYKRLKKLVEERTASSDEFDVATRNYRVAEARLAAARDQLALAREGTRAEEIAQAEATLAEAQAALALLENGYRVEEIGEARANAEAARAAVAVIRQQLSELRIVAPVESVVDAVDLEPGDLVAPNAPVITLIDARRPWVRAFVPENRLDIRVGQKVSIAVDAFPKRRFAGHVAFVSRQAEFTPANVQTSEERIKQMFRIKVVLDEGADDLRPGMAADVFFDAQP